MAKVDKSIDPVQPEAAVTPTAAEVIADHNKIVKAWQISGTFSDDQLNKLIIPRLQSQVKAQIEAGFYTCDVDPGEAVKEIKL
jgi:type VI protein secretion system component VasK